MTENKTYTKDEIITLIRNEINIWDYAEKDYAKILSDYTSNNPSSDTLTSSDYLYCLSKIDEYKSYKKALRIFLLDFVK